MEANKLMVGDLMRVNRIGLCIRKGTVVQVRGIDGDNKIEERGLFGAAHCRPLDEDQFDGGIWLDYLDPIPITPEILEKNGFIEDEKTEFGKVYHLLVPTGFEKNSYTIQVTLFKEPICGVNVLFKCWGWIPPYNGGINDIHLCGIGFIHEMQHALRLCGIEKEIVL